MGPQETVAGVGNARKELGPPERVVASAFGYDGAERVCLQFEILGIATRPDLRTQSLCSFNGRRVAAAQSGQAGKNYRAGNCVLLLACDVSFDMVRGFMAHDKGQFVFVTGIGDQSQGERDNRTPGPVLGLVGICGLSGPIIHHDVKVAIHPCCARPTFALRDRLNRPEHADAGCETGPETVAGSHAANKVNAAMAT